MRVRLRSKIRELYSYLISSDEVVSVLTALLVGVIAGFGAIFFRWLIKAFTHLSFDGGKTALGFLGQYYVVPIPAVGGIFVGLLVYFFAREAKGHGVPEVMEAVALQHGRIRPIVSIIKTFASSICIGTGGSVGREGPIVQIGSSLGSMLGQKLRLSGEGIRTLVACGAAGGISATFNAPLAGIIFSAEVILNRFRTSHFIPIIIASIAANEISRLFLGNFPAFEVPTYKLVSPWELPLYVVLGMLAALVALVLIFTLYGLEDLFDAWRFPEYLKPAVGGLGVGLIGVYFPQIFGVGYGTIEEVLLNPATEEVLLNPAAEETLLNPSTGALLLLVLLFVKITAMSVTLGSGGSGGVFAPSLFTGAMLGGAFGLLVHSWFPAFTGSSGAYALVGMAAVFGAAAHAPITAVLIVFEMTRDYEIMLPLALAVAFSTVIARFLHSETIYTAKLKRRGVDLSALEDVDLMRTIKVRQAMCPVSKLVTVDPEMPFDDMTWLFQKHHSHGFAVVDNGRALVGVVTLSDVERAIRSGDLKKTVGDICTTDVHAVFPDQTLEDVMRYFGNLDVGRIPVLARGNSRALVGMIGRGDIIRAYSRTMVRSQAAHSNNDLT